MLCPPEEFDHAHSIQLCAYSLLNKMTNTVTASAGRENQLSLSLSVFAASYMYFKEFEALDTYIDDVEYICLELHSLGIYYITLLYNTYHMRNERNK